MRLFARLCSVRYAPFGARRARVVFGFYVCVRSRSNLDSNTNFVAPFSRLPIWLFAHRNVLFVAMRICEQLRKVARRASLERAISVPSAAPQLVDSDPTRPPPPPPPPTTLIEICARLFGRGKHAARAPKRRDT